MLYYTQGIKMAFVDKIKKFFKRKEQVRSEKEKATLAGEPWVTVLKVDIDPNSPAQGYFELDWNDHFVTMLSRAGYAGPSADSIVDQWFSDLCNGIARSQLEEEKFIANADILQKR